MNTTTCGTPIIHRTVRPLWQRTWEASLDAARAWLRRQRQQARQRAEWRALAELDDATLRDIGLAERRAPHDAARAGGSGLFRS